MLDVADRTHGSGLPRGSKAMVSGIGAPTLCVALLALPAAHAADFKVLSPEPAVHTANGQAAMSAEVDLFESRQVSG
jgi:hypothetical protein